MFFEREAHPALKFAHGSVLLRRARPEGHQKDHLRAFYRVDAQHLRVGDKDVPELLAVSHIHGNLGEHRGHHIGIGREIDADMDRRNRIVCAHVGNGSDLRIGNDKEGAVVSANRGFAQGQGFNNAFYSGDVHGIAHAELAFYQDQESVEHVFDDVLCRETDGDARHSGGGQ